MRVLFDHNIRRILFCFFLIIFIVSGAPDTVEANGAVISTSASRTPSGSIYPGDSYAVKVTITNSGSGSPSVSNDWWYKRKFVGGSWSGWLFWTSSSASVTNGSPVTLSQTSTAEPAGTEMQFQINSYWPSCPSCTNASASGFTVQPRPVATADLTASSPVPFNNGTYLQWTSSNTSSCTLTNFGGVPTSHSSNSYYTGNLTSDKTFTLSCTRITNATGDPTDSFTVQVSPPPTLTATLSASPSSITAGNSTNLSTSLGGTAAGSVTYSGHSCGGGSISGNTSSSGSFTCGYSSAGSYTASITAQRQGVTASDSETVTVTPASFTLSVSPSGSGSVFCNGGSCASSYAPGTALTLTASPASDFSFSGWGGACSGAGSCSLTMNSDKTVTASFTPLPTNSISVETRLDGGALGGITISQSAGAPSGMGGSTFYTRSTTASVDITLTAPLELSGGNRFQRWEGCASTSGLNCRVVLSGGGNVFPIARYISPAMLPNLTASITKVVGSRSKETNQLLAKVPGASYEVEVIATIANGGGSTAVNDHGGFFDVDFEYQDGGGWHSFGGANIDLGGALASLPPGSKKISGRFVPPQAGSFPVRVCPDPPSSASDPGLVTESSETDNCAATTVVAVHPPVPSPLPACAASFVDDVTIDGSRAWTIDVSGKISGCDPSRWQNLRVGGDADDAVPLSETFDRVFNYLEGVYRNLSSSEAGLTGSMCKADRKAIGGSSGSNACSGDLEARFAPSGTNLLPVVSDTVFSGRYKNRELPNNFLFESQHLPWGNYPVYITQTFEGGYACTLGGTTTDYHPECDTDNVAFAGGCAVETTADFGPVWKPFRVAPELTLCAIEPAEGDESGYVDMQCAVHNPDVDTIDLVSCDTGNPYTVTPAIVPTTVNIPSQSPRPEFVHTLNVNSAFDGTQSPGVTIAERSVFPSDTKPTESRRVRPTTESLPNTDFGGPTDYYKKAHQNFTVTLRAPATRVSPSGAFSGWSGCDNTAFVPGDPAGTPNRDCTAEFAFAISGGQTKTVTANYSGSLAVPELLTATPLCTDGEGKVKVWLPGTVAGATGYKLYRGGTAGFTPIDDGVSGDNQIANFTVAGGNVPATSTPYIDTGLATTSDHFYKMRAYNNSVASSISAAVQDDASKRCPDLVVESITLPNSAGLPAGTVLSSSSGHIFSAVIKNQGEGTDATKTFFNKISVGGAEVKSDFPNPANQPITGGLTAGGTPNSTRTITSGTWTADTVTSATTRTVEVCADRPPLPPDRGNVIEANPDGTSAELNNCKELSVNIVPPITVQLEVEKAGTNTYKSDYVVVDYQDLANLRWIVTGSPTSCAGKTGTDLTGAVTPQSYTVSGNPFSLTNLLNKLSFKYQLECTR